MWTWNKEKYPFGLAEIKREGQRIGPITYLKFRGEWPPRDFYNNEQYKQLQEDGWEYCQDEAKHERD